MRISYNKLWKLLIDKNMNKNDLKATAGISSASVAKLGKETLGLSFFGDYSFFTAPFYKMQNIHKTERIYTLSL